MGLKARPVYLFAISAWLNARAKKKQNEGCATAGLCGLPLIEHKTLDEWGTVSSNRGSAAPMNALIQNTFEFSGLRLAEPFCEE
jgi:hypothetical protein